MEVIRANQKRCRYRMVLIISGVWAASCAGIVASAQSSQPSAVAPTTIPYSNPTFGFEMRIPAGWVYDRARFQGPAGALGLVRGERPDGAQMVEVLIFRSFELADFPAWVQDLGKQLGKLYGTKQIQVEMWTEATRPRAVLVCDAKMGGFLTRTHYACVPFDPSTVWVLALASRMHGDADEQALRKQFDEIADSLNISYDPVEAEQIAAAFERGLTVCRELRATAANVPIDETERYYDISVGGKEIGYLVRWMRREDQMLDDPRSGSKHKKGLRVHEESWRFADDGTVRCTDLNLFSSFDLRSELIESRTTQIPAPDVPSQRLYIELDQCVREDRVLFSSFSTNIDADLPDPRPPLPIGPRYLDLAWTRLLPHLLRKAPAETYAFAVYDSQARALTVHTIRPLGPDKIPGPRGGPGYVFEVREGFAARPARIYTDAMGIAVRVEGGDLVIQRTTKDDVERKYADRREPARLRLQLPARPGSRP